MPKKTRKYPSKKKTTTLNGYREYKKLQMREYRRRKKTQLRKLFLDNYDWLMDAYIILREEAKQLAVL